MNPSVGWLACLLLCQAGSVWAAESGPACEEARVKIRAASVLGSEPSTLAPGRQVAIEFDKDGFAAAEACGKPGGLLLYVDHIPLPSLERVAEAGENRFIYWLSYGKAKDERALWQRIWERSAGTSSGAVPVGVGTATKEFDYASKATYREASGRVTSKPFAAEVASDTRMTWAAIAAFAVLIAGCCVAWLTELTRDRSFQPAAQSAQGAPRSEGATPAAPPAFSLGRTQFLACVIVIAMAAVFVFVVTGTLPDLTGKILALLGISAATMGAATVVDVNRQAPAAPAKNALADILSDKQGLAVHRFQQVLFTLGLLAYLGWDAVRTLTFPDLDSNWLLASGLSSGTYVGMKASEAKPA